MKQGDTWWRFQAVLLCKNDSYIHEFMFHCILRSLLTRASFLTSFWKKSCLLSRMLVSFGAPGPLRMAPPKLFHRLSRRLVGISTAASFIGFEVPVRKASKFPVFGLELPEFPKKWCGCPASLKILARLVGWFLVFFWVLVSMRVFSASLLSIVRIHYGGIQCHVNLPLGIRLEVIVTIVSKLVSF